MWLEAAILATHDGVEDNIGESDIVVTDVVCQQVKGIGILENSRATGVGGSCTYLQAVTKVGGRGSPKECRRRCW